MMGIYLELFCKFDVRNKYGSALKQFHNHIRTVPSCAQPPLKELKVRILELYVIIDLKGSSSHVPIMKGLGLLFVDLYILVHVVP